MDLHLTVKGSLLGARKRATMLVVLLILSLRAPPTFSQATCSAPSTVLTSEDDIMMLSSKPADCRTITGHLVFGHQNCASPCTLTSLARLDNVENIEGSITIQCCHELISLNMFPSLTSFTGDLRIYYNRELTMISGLGQLPSLDGSIVISQNSKLTGIRGFNALRTVTGYLAIQYNPVLTSLAGFSQLSSIGGQEILSGHALTLLYNINLTNLAGFSNLESIAYGTVHIEGNTALCYAGYPTWTVGSYSARMDDSVSEIDRGIDWRTKQSGVEQWQYTWDVQGEGYPTLYIQNNAPNGNCGSATCHPSCPTNAGCLGPNDAALCGSCISIGGINPCAGGTPATAATAAPTEGGGSNVGVVVGVVIVVLVVVAVLAMLGILLFILCRRKLKKGKMGSFDITALAGEEGGNDSTKNFALHSSTASDLIASSSTDQHDFGKRKNQHEMENVVTVSSYKKADSFESQGVSVISNKHAKSTPSPRGISRSTHPKIGKKSTASTENLLSSDGHDNSNTDLPDLGYENEQYEERQDDSSLEEPKRESLTERRLSTEVITEKLKQRNNEINTNFPKDQVKLGKQIGMGDFGKVIQAEARKLIPGQKKTSVVVKQLKETATKEEKEEFLRPVEAMKVLKHPNVLSLMGVVTSGPNILVMLEYCSHGNLKTFLVSRRREAANFKSSGQLLKMSKDLAAGLGYLHTMSIAHNDLAVRNCLVTKEGAVKLGDYGISRHLFKEDYYSRNPGQKAWPIRWMAPEQVRYQDRTMLDSHPVSMSANIWSFGVTLWEVCSFAQWPYDEMSNEEVIEMVIRTGKCSLECPFKAGENIVFLYACCQLCWQDDGNRPHIEEIISMLAEPSSIQNKRRKSSLTRQHIVSTVPQCRSKTLPAISKPWPSLQGSDTSRGSPAPRDSLVTAKIVPLSDEKSKVLSTVPVTRESSVSSNTSSSPVQTFVTTSSPSPVGKPANSKSITSTNEIPSTSKPGPLSQDSNTGTLRKPKRPAPGKPVPTKENPVQKQVSTNSNDHTGKPVQPVPKRPAPVRSAPQQPKSTAEKRDNDTSHPIQPQEVEKIEVESSNKVKRVHSYRSNRKSNEVVKSRQSGEKEMTPNASLVQDSQNDESDKIPAPQQSLPSGKPLVPSAQNLGYLDTENEIEEKNIHHSTTDDFCDSDMDETYFLGGGESLPKEDFILDPPEHFSESSVGELEEEQPALKTNEKSTSDSTELKQSSKTETAIQSKNGGIEVQFLPPSVSDDEDETKFDGVGLMESKKEDKPHLTEGIKSTDNEGIRPKKAKKKKKKKIASREIADEDDALKVKGRKKKRSTKQSEEEQKEKEEEQLPEYLHDRGLDRVPMRSSQDNAVVQASHYISSYCSNDSLDTEGNGSQTARKRHKSYYGDVVATDEFTPPWLEDDDPNEGEDDEDPYAGEDDPPNVVYDEEVSSLLW